MFIQKNRLKKDYLSICVCECDNGCEIDKCSKNCTRMKSSIDDLVNKCDKIVNASIDCIDKNVNVKWVIDF